MPHRSILAHLPVGGMGEESRRACRVAWKHGRGAVYVTGRYRTLGAWLSARRLDRAAGGAGAAAGLVEALAQLPPGVTAGAARYEIRAPGPDREVLHATYRPHQAIVRVVV